MFGCLGCRLLSGVALIHKSHLHHVSGSLLDLSHQIADLCTLLLIGWRDLQSQQMPQGIHSDMDFGALAPLVSIIASTSPALGCGLHGATIEDHRAGLPPFSGKQANENSQIVRHRFKAPGRIQRCVC